MADAYPETLVEAGPAAPAQRRSWLHWAKRIFVLALCLWLADAGISLLIEHSRLRDEFTARLAAAFGRPVEVEGYRFSLWRGPALEARSVTVGEDPRFGNEYFLRAESLTMRLRWVSLLRGRLELGTLSLTRPSLNLVRNAAGDWNLAEWLPKPAEPRAANAAASSSQAPLRFRKIAVDGGRINFKQGDEKIPFALAEVMGTVETEGSGQWRLDLEATPWRAAVILQQGGMLRLAGHVGGTSSRLLPADLALSWTDASISDVLRLARGDDRGIRGAFALSMNARTAGSVWMLDARASLAQLHRWDLALRPDNPSLNLIATAQFNPRTSSLDPVETVLELPRSSALATARIHWNGSRAYRSATSVPGGQEKSPVSIEISGSKISMADLLAWLRAFHPGVADDAALQGWVEVKGNIVGEPAAVGGPLRLVNATVSTQGAELTGAHIPVPVRLGSAKLLYDRGSVILSPATIDFGSAGNSLRIEAARKPPPGAANQLRVSANLAEVRDAIAAAGSLGWNLSRGWDLGGPFRCDLQWKGAQSPWQTLPTGWAEVGLPAAAVGPVSEKGGASLRAPFLNLPVVQIQGHMEWKPGARHVVLSSAQAFGTHWSGTFDRRDTADEWRFALSAGRLTATSLDRWLNPRWKETFLSRILPFLNSRAASGAVPESLRASGRLNADEFVLAPAVVNRLQGDLTVEGRHIALSNAKGQFFGGAIGGSLGAELLPSPIYSVALNFSGVDLAALSAGSPDLAGLFAGTASGEAVFHARGASRSDLLASLECRGTARVSGAGLRWLELEASLREVAPQPGTSAFSEATAAFACGQKEIAFQNLSLVGADDEIDGAGTVDFSRNLDFRLGVFPLDESGNVGPISEAPEKTYRLTGPLAAPQITRLSPPPRRAAR